MQELTGFYVGARFLSSVDASDRPVHMCIQTPELCMNAKGRCLGEGVEDVECRAL